MSENFEQYSYDGLDAAMAAAAAPPQVDPLSYNMPPMDQSAYGYEAPPVTTMEAPNLESFQPTNQLGGLGGLLGNLPMGNGLLASLFGNLNLLGLFSDEQSPGLPEGFIPNLNWLYFQPEDGSLSPSLEQLLLANLPILNILNVLPEEDLVQQGLVIWRHDPVTGETTNITPDFRGFGDSDNRYPWSMTDFDGKLFVGTLNEHPTYGGLLGSLLGQSPSSIESNGGEIWMLDCNDQWVQVFGPDVNTAEENLLVAGQAGFREMIVFDGHIVAATSNQLVPGLIQASDTPANIIWSADGTCWEELPRLEGGGNDPFDNSENASVRAMNVFSDQMSPPAEPAGEQGAEFNGFGQDYLVVGTQVGLLSGESPELWAFYENCEGPNWIRLDGGEYDANIEGFAISEIITWQGQYNTGESAGEMQPPIYGNSLVFGTWNVEGFNLYIQNGIYGDIEDITPQGIWRDANNNGYQDCEEPTLYSGDFGDVSPFDDLGVLKLFTANGYLYLGTVDYIDGTTLMRTNTPWDNDSWQLITMDGFETEIPGSPETQPLTGPGNFYIWSAAVVPQSNPDQEGQELDFGEACRPLDTIYVGTFGGLSGDGKVLRSTDGVNFEYVTDDAFGETNIYGIRSMEYIGDQVYIGGSSNALYPSFEMAI